jgi:hypothetical protein
VNNPAEEEEPQHSGEDELNDGFDQTTLEELTKAGNKEATERGDDVSRSTRP